MSEPAFFLVNGNLTFDPSKPNFCTSEPEICYGVKVPVPVPVPVGAGIGSGGGDGFSYPCNISRNEEFYKIAKGPWIKGLRKGECIPDPLTVEKIKREIARNVQKKEIYDLKAQVFSLKKELTRARRSGRASAKIRRALRAMRRKVQKLYRRIAIHENALRALALRPLEPVGMSDAAPPRSVGGLLCFTVSALSALATYYLVPEKSRGLKMAGYGTAVILLAAGIWSYGKRGAAV